MPRVGRRFVPQSTIDRRVQAKDDRLHAAITAFRRRTSNAALFPAPPIVPVVVEVAIVPDPEAHGPVVEVALVPVTHHTSFPKPSTRLSRAIAKKAARLEDAKRLRAWATAVKARDHWKDRRTGVRVFRTLALDPLRAEAHHVVSKDDPAVRYDVRNGICLSLATHLMVEMGQLRIEGSAWFKIGGVSYIDATAPVRFVRT